MQVLGLEQIHETGTFFLDECIPVQARQRAHDALIRLFDLPITRKMQFLAPKTQDPLAAGFSPYGVAKALDSGVPNLLETWDIGNYRTKWPKEMIASYAEIKAYEHLLSRLCVVAVSLIEQTFSSHTGILRELIKGRRTGLHLIHYFPVPADAPSTARRQSEHTDNTIVTLIPPPFPLDKDIIVYNRHRDRWESKLVPPAGCLVQAGRILEMVTTRRLQACTHTIKTPRFGDAENKHRYSTPFFCSPREDALFDTRESSPELTKEANTLSYSQLQSAYFSDIFRV